MNLSVQEVQILKHLNDVEQSDDVKIAKSLNINDLEEVRKMLTYLKDKTFIKGTQVDQGNWVFVVITTNGREFIREQSKISRIEWLEMMSMINEGQNDIYELTRHFGPIKFEKLSKFLYQKKYIMGSKAELLDLSDANVFALIPMPVELELTPDGHEYYANETESKLPEPNVIINAKGSNVAYHSPYANQTIKISENEITPEIKALLLKLSAATKQNDIEAVSTLINKLKSMSAEIFNGVIASGIFQFLSQYAIS